MHSRKGAVDKKRISFATIKFRTGVCELFVTTKAIQCITIFKPFLSSISHCLHCSPGSFIAHFELWNFYTLQNLIENFKRAHDKNELPYQLLMQDKPGKNSKNARSFLVHFSRRFSPFLIFSHASRVAEWEKQLWVSGSGSFLGAPSWDLKSFHFFLSFAPLFVVNFKRLQLICLILICLLAKRLNGVLAIGKQRSFAKDPLFSAVSESSMTTFTAPLSRRKVEPAEFSLDGTMHKITQWDKTSFIHSTVKKDLISIIDSCPSFMDFIANLTLFFWISNTIKGYLKRTHLDENLNTFHE